MITLLLPQFPGIAGTNRDNLSGGALGIIQCSHIKGKTRIVWQVIVSEDKPPINGVKFNLVASGENRDIFQGVIPPTTNYQTIQIFDSIKKGASITGEAYNISLSGVYRYWLRKPLTVKCN